MPAVTKTSGVCTDINCKKAKIRILMIKRLMRRADKTEGVKNFLTPGILSSQAEKVELVSGVSATCYKTLTSA